jgi:hypothetical protein
MITAERWYDQNPDISTLYQGDIIDDVPLVFMPPVGKGWVLLRPSPPVMLHEALSGKTPKAFLPKAEKMLSDAWTMSSEFVLAKAALTRVMVTNHMCDIENRSFLQVAPVRNADELGGGKRGSLRTNEIKYLFYLPEYDAFPESFADLSQTTPVHRSYLRGKRAILRLTSTAMTELQNQIAEFQAREFGFNPTDTAPQEADYACANCFFRDAVVQRRHFLAMERFIPCHTCGDNVLWVKLG